VVLPPKVSPPDVVDGVLPNPEGCVVDPKLEGVVPDEVDVPNGVVLPNPVVVDGVLPNPEG
jgi:hypothetical protein